ncbi:MAG TPA: Mth938-like domain-containing protein [Gammaproteobacteria bacterium]
MKFSLDKTHSLYTIDGFTPHSVTVAQHEYTNHLIVTPERIFTDWRPPAVNRLGSTDFACLAELELEVILLGTGNTQIFPPQLLQVELARAGTGFEVMTTPAACRTFNILASEGRRVAAALIIGI